MPYVPDVPVRQVCQGAHLTESELTCHHTSHNRLDAPSASVFVLLYQLLRQYVCYCTSTARKRSACSASAGGSAAGMVAVGVMCERCARFETRRGTRYSRSLRRLRCCMSTCIRQHTSAYVSIRQHRDIRGSSEDCAAACQPAYFSIRQHTSAYVSIRQDTSAYVRTRQHTSGYVRIRQDASGYVCCMST